MKAAIQHLSVEQGTTYERNLTFYTSPAKTTRINLTGYTLKAQVRADWDKALRVEIGLTITNAAQGEVKMIIEPEQTRTLKPGSYQWDMLVTAPSGKVLKYTKGAFELTPTQTKLSNG